MMQIPRVSNKSLPVNACSPFLNITTWACFADTFFVLIGAKKVLDVVTNSFEKIFVFLFSSFNNFTSSELSKISFAMSFVTMKQTLPESRENVSFSNLIFMLCGVISWYLSLIMAATQLSSDRPQSELYVLLFFILFIVFSSVSTSISIFWIVLLFIYFYGTVLQSSWKFRCYCISSAMQYSSVCNFVAIIVRNSCSGFCGFIYRIAD